MFENTQVKVSIELQSNEPLRITPVESIETVRLCAAFADADVLPLA